MESFRSPAAPPQCADPAVATPLPLSAGVCRAAASFLQEARAGAKTLPEPRSPSPAGWWDPPPAPFATDSPDDFHCQWDPTHAFWDGAHSPLRSYLAAATPASAAASSPSSVPGAYA